MPSEPTRQNNVTFRSKTSMSKIKREDGLISDLMKLKRGSGCEAARKMDEVIEIVSKCLV
jgi:hypothetical protein